MEKGYENLYDVAVIGGGPAGLTAALYLARARYRVMVIEKEHFGGQITITSQVVNYPGVEQASGVSLTDTMRRQAEGFGAEFLLAEVLKLRMDGDVKTVFTSRGELRCFGVLLAAGAHPRRAGFPGEEEFRGRGVAYCATCDGEFFTGKEVFVVGGGFAAAEESVFLTKYASHVTILIRGDGFTCAPAVAEPALDHEKITVLTNREVKELKGYMEELGRLTDKLRVEIAEEKLAERPCVRILREDGTWTGLAFHGVPGGHEFTSFVLGLYNAAGPGQTIGQESMARLKELVRPVRMKILVSLSCTMCPELVTAAQKIAAENPNVTAEVYDLNHFPDLRDTYRVMSVPCLVINDGEQVSFGKKNVGQLLDLLHKGP